MTNGNTNNASGTPDVGSGTADIASGTENLEAKEFKKGLETVSKPNAVPWNKDPMDAVEEACEE